MTNDKQVIVNYWNSLPGLIHARVVDNYTLKVLDKRLMQYPMCKLLESTKIYCCILTGSEWFEPILGIQDFFFYTYRHHIREFFRDGVVKLAPYIKFFSESQPLTNFMNYKYKKNTFYVESLQNEYKHLYTTDITGANEEAESVLRGIIESNGVKR